MCHKAFRDSDEIIHMEVCPFKFRPAVAAALREVQAERDALAQQLERATIEREQLAKTYDKTVDRLEREIVQHRGEYVRGLERALTVLHTQMARGWDGSMIMMYQAIQAEIDKDDS